MSDIPKGADAEVARMAIAWAITKEAWQVAAEKRGGAIDTENGRVEAYTEIFNKAYHALLEQPDES